MPDKRENDRHQQTEVSWMEIVVYASSILQSMQTKIVEFNVS